MAPDVSLPILPMLALNPAEALPASTITLAGTVILPELEVNETVVFAATDCDSVTVQVLVEFDVKLVGLQTNEVTCNEAPSERVTD